MDRNLHELTQNTYDMLIIGGGIYGACLAWEGSLRGLSVALVEQSDFGSATSANSLKIIHGGLRYLQHADFKRMRESIKERQTLMRIAPHLVHPLPVLIPTYGHGLEGKEVMTLALAINDLVSFDRNKGADPQKFIPAGRAISKSEILQKLPDLNQKRLTGGVLFYDAQVYNSERLLLSFLRSSWMKGARFANYVQVVGYLQESEKVIGVQAQDVLHGHRLEIRSRCVVNTCGPWINHVQSYLNGNPVVERVSFSKAMNLVTKPVFSDFAVGLASRHRYRDNDAVVQKGKRLLFVVPWRGYSMIGTTYSPCEGHSHSIKVSSQEIQNFLDEVNSVYPSAKLKIDDVSFVHSGLLPCAGNTQDKENVQLAKHYQIIRHDRHGLKGVLSVVGVKYTTARFVAQKVVDEIFEMFGKVPPPSRTETTPIYGGHIDRVEEFMELELRKHASDKNDKTIERLIKNYGTAYTDVMAYLNEVNLRGQSNPWSLCHAEVLHGIRAEMAQKLTDVICRRTELGSAAYPGDEVLTRCADIMRTELGWTEQHMQREIQETKDVYVRN